jgi:hypothetical protein
VQLSVLEHDGDATLLELVLREGRNRQIRRTAGLLGHPVLDLQRIAIGDLELADLPEGRWRRVQAGELVPEDGQQVSAEGSLIMAETGKPVDSEDVLVREQQPQSSIDFIHLEHLAEC